MKLPARFTTAWQQLHADAVAATGLQNFGDDDYREALSVLLQAYDDSARFSELGRYSAYAGLVNCLKGRLYTQHGIDSNPTCLEGNIEKPIFIVGLPRTGTTILHRLLARDPANQGLEYWLGSYPMPRPPRRDWPSLPSYREVDESLQMLGQLNPELKAIHEMTADGVDECRLLLMHCFANVSFQANATVPAYEEWLYNANFQPVYRYYRNSLKLIGSNQPERRWVLKDPSHLWAMDTLLETFPDACIVQTHRDPVSLIASVSSLVFSARQMLEPDTTAAAVGSQQLLQWARVLDKTMAVRERFPENFIDVYFDDFVADPVAVVDTIYRHHGQQLDDGLADQLRRWMLHNPQGKHGDHHYSPQDFGLSENGILEIFTAYKDRFGV